MSWDWSVLVDARVSDGQVDVVIGPVVWIAAFGLLALWVVWQRPWRALKAPWKVSEISPTFFGTTWKIVRDSQTAQLAHEAYVELITRKAGLAFDEDHDVIVEVYDSWYQLFGEIRRLARRLDADSIARNADLRRLHDLLIDVLNRGLRPHLTEWQAKFRRWYANEASNRPGESPQAIQRDYSEYSQLVTSLREANQLLITLAQDLRRLSHGDEESQS
jgi:hypothetical protein